MVSPGSFPAVSGYCLLEFVFSFFLYFPLQSSSCSFTKNQKSKWVLLISVYFPILNSSYLVPLSGLCMSDIRGKGRSARTSSRNYRQGGGYIWNPRRNPGCSEPPPSIHSYRTIMTVSLQSVTCEENGGKFL